MSNVYEETEWSYFQIDCVTDNGNLDDIVDAHNRVLDKMKQAQSENKRLKKQIETLWHLANAYDGNHAAACDSVMEICAREVAK